MGRRSRSTPGTLPRHCRVSQASLSRVLNRAVASWSACYGPAPAFESVRHESCLEAFRRVKRFLASPPSLSQEEQFAWSSIKKLLPRSCKCMEQPLLESVVESLCREPPVLPDGYLPFCRRVLRRLFVKGWDKSYHSMCLQVSPPLSGVVESSRRDGGVLGWGADRIEYLDHVLGGKAFRGSTRAEAMVVQSAGKPRPLTKFSADAFLLSPLHDTLYSYISKFPWLLRGDVRGSALDAAGFSLSPDTVLVSGDYASATDNLSIEVAELILEVCSESSLDVPRPIWDYAFRILRPEVHFLRRDPSSGSIDSDWLRPTRGQMMGSYLSFPLLCLQNYLAFRWAKYSRGHRGHIPLLINGDDILFSFNRVALPGFDKSWRDSVASVGLVVEESKTSVAHEFGSLNSTLLRWSSTGVLRVAPTLRFGRLREPEFLNSSGRNFREFVRGVPPDVAWAAGKEFFRWNIAAFRRAGRLSADEWGFRGRLALRLATIFNLSAFAREPVEPPPPPSVHNVQVPPELVVPVERGSLSDELAALNAAEMTCWKWSHEYNRVSDSIRYCVRLTTRRPVAPPDVFAQVRYVEDDSDLSPESLSRRLLTVLDVRPLNRSRLSDPSKRVLKARFFADAVPGVVGLFRELLGIQDFSEFERLPPYQEVEYDFRLEHEKK